MHSINSKTTLFLSVASSLILTACSGDKTVQQYKQDKYTQNLAQLQQVQGRYSGPLLANQDGSLMGYLQVDLSAQSQVLNSSDESISTAQPVLTANIQFKIPTVAQGSESSVQNNNNMMIIAQKASFIPSTGVIQADIPIQMRDQNGNSSGDTVTVHLQGVISGNTLKGTISANSLDSYGGTFNLTTTNPTAQSMAQETAKKIAARNSDKNVASDVPTLSQNFLFNGTSYNGTTTFYNSSFQVISEKNVSMAITIPSANSEEQNFANMLYTKKRVLVSLNYGAGAHISLSGFWNQDQGTINAQGQLTRTSPSLIASTTDTITINLACQSGAGSINKTFVCKLTNSIYGDAAPIAGLTLTSTEGQKPTDTINTSNPIIADFNGNLSLGNRAPVPVVLRVVYPPKTRMDDILDLIYQQTQRSVTGTLIIISTDSKGAEINSIPINFNHGIWEEQLNRLSISESIVSSDGTLNLTVLCSDIHLSSVNSYNFQCDYHSSNSADYGKITFKK